MPNTRLTHRILVSAALAVGLFIGLAAPAAAQNDKEADFLQCVVDHQDSDGIGVCCIFYGGTYDERSKECYIDFNAQQAPTLASSRPRQAAAAHSMSFANRGTVAPST